MCMRRELYRCLLLLLLLLLLVLVLNPVFTRALSYALSKLGKPGLVLKEEQKQAIATVYRGRDVFVWLPTSVCFQALPFVFDYKLGLVNTEKKSLAIIIAPLVSLMVEQVQSLQAQDVAAAIVSSGGRESRVAEGLLASKDTLDSASLVFCSPLHFSQIIDLQELVLELNPGSFSPRPLNRATALFEFTTVLHKRHTLLVYPL